MTGKIYRNIEIIALLIGFSFFFTSVSGTTLSPSLSDISNVDSANDSLISIVIFIDDNSGSNGALKASLASNINLKKRHEAAVNALITNHAIVTGDIAGKIMDIYPNAKIRKFWIAPVISATIPLSKLQAVSSILGISAIYEDGILTAFESVELGNSPTQVNGVSSHLTKLNIPALWSRGITGKGRLVCNFDTGVEGSHPALKDKWRGNHASFDASFFAPSSSLTTTFDKTGHGTHTMGLMVGNNDIDSFGVAPDAEWIAGAVVDQGLPLDQTLADIIAAFQWAVDPDGNPATVDDMPDVILNSWGVPTSIMDPCDETFYQVIDNVEAAGIVTIFAAGNEGPDPQTLRVPATRASTPFNTFSVGAIDGSTNEVASFSSRGPSSCNTSALKPEVVAPGVDLYSCTKGGIYTYKNGTSMAAPLIAGLVALLREYNPDATVNEIKNAIIMSCVDLGSTGEDNDYGYGLPNALAALQYMPTPNLDGFEIAHQFISGDGIAELGETFELHIGLRKPDVMLDSVIAVLSTNVEGVNIILDQAIFIFENKSEYSISSNPYEIEFSTELPNGQVIPMNLKVYTSVNECVDTVEVNVLVGVPISGSLATHETSHLEFTVSDFGQSGLGENSIFYAGGDGFTYNGSQNLLYESGIIVGRNFLQISSSVRDSLGKAFNSDFGPVEELTIDESIPDASFISRSRFSDSGSDILIPVAVRQAVASYTQFENENYLIFKYYIINPSLSSLTDLNFGFFNDFDIDTAGDNVGFDEEHNLIYQYANGTYIGIIPIVGAAGYVTIDNGSEKAAFSNVEKMNFISEYGINIDTVNTSDFITLMNFGPYNIQAHDSVEIGIALIVGNSLAELLSSADKAIEKYYTPTSVDEIKLVLPNEFELHQNYPNPFNPTTTISFSISRATLAKLSVYNILGQEVITLFDGIMNAGTHNVEWNGTNNIGCEVGSGVYFYKLTTENETFSRKMMLLK